jgi:hypothetical protein
MWLRQRLDSEMKRVFGQETLDRDTVQSTLDSQLILAYSSSRAKEAAGKVLN